MLRKTRFTRSQTPNAITIARMYSHRSNEKHKRENELKRNRVALRIYSSSKTATPEHNATQNARC